MLPGNMLPTTCCRQIVASLLPVCCCRIQRDTCCRDTGNMLLATNNMLPGNTLLWCKRAFILTAWSARAQTRICWTKCLCELDTQHWIPPQRHFYRQMRNFCEVRDKRITVSGVRYRSILCRFCNAIATQNDEQSLRVNEEREKTVCSTQ